jgi:hypothetical protein
MLLGSKRMIRDFVTASQRRDSGTMQGYEKLQYTADTQSRHITVLSNLIVNPRHLICSYVKEW